MDTAEILWFLTLLQAASGSSSYQILNYTWTVSNSWGDVVWSKSQVTHQTPWLDLYPDLCKLALGAPGWDLQDYHNQQSPPLKRPGTWEKKRRYMEGAGGCSEQRRRRKLRAITFYVCPGVHRDRSMTYRCGGPTDFYCASWGCDTTGDTYWGPSSDWDYIKVSANYSHPAFEEAEDISGCDSWCHPLRIQFTEPGKKYLFWNRGATWGLRLYKGYRDNGLIFSIKLLQHPPTPTAAIGPNPKLHPGKGQGRPHSKTNQKGPTKPTKITPIAPIPFRSTIPEGPPISS